jgi:hypothetical protein
MNLNRFVADALARLHTLELREVDIMCVPLSPRKFAHGQTADKPWLNAKITAQFQKLLERLLEFVVNVRE